MYDVVALGELLIDFAQQEVDQSGYPTMKANPGGAPANFLAALNKYGKKVGFIGKVGQDTFGSLLISTLQSASISTQGIIVDKDYFTTLAFVTLDDKGDRSFSFARKPGADTQLTFEEVDKSLLEQTKVLHFGTLSLTDDPMRSTTQKVVAYAKAHDKLISFDPNLRVPLWHDLEQARNQILWGLAQADFVKISDEEVEFLWNCPPLEGANRILNDFGASLVLLTEGAKGCTALHKSASASAVCPQVTPIDTTGAGDICGGSAMTILLDLNKPFCDLTQAELAQVAQFATTSASLSTEKNGGIPSIPEKKIVLNCITTSN